MTEKYGQPTFTNAKSLLDVGMVPNRKAASRGAGPPPT